MLSDDREGKLKENINIKYYMGVFYGKPCNITKYLTLKKMPCNIYKPIVGRPAGGNHAWQTRSNSNHKVSEKSTRINLNFPEDFINYLEKTKLSLKAGKLQDQTITLISWNL